MANQVPPPLPTSETALATYLKAFATTCPALLIWLFANDFLLPKLQWLWQHTNLTGSRAQWLLDASDFFAHSVPFAFPGVIALLIVLELCVRS